MGGGKRRKEGGNGGVGRQTLLSEAEVCETGGCAWPPSGGGCASGTHSWGGCAPLRLEPRCENAGNYEKLVACRSPPPSVWPVVELLLGSPALLFHGSLPAQTGGGPESGRQLDLSWAVRRCSSMASLIALSHLTAS